jgi:hypothetical protein
MCTTCGWAVGVGEGVGDGLGLAEGVDDGFVVGLGIGALVVFELLQAASAAVATAKATAPMAECLSTYLLLESCVRFTVGDKPEETLKDRF